MFGENRKNFVLPWGFIFIHRFKVYLCRKKLFFYILLSHLVVHYKKTNEDRRFFRSSLASVLRVAERETITVFCSTLFRFSLSCLQVKNSFEITSSFFQQFELFPVVNQKSPQSFVNTLDNHMEPVAC